ncbi:type II toxin-antitoxin system HipA family toxin [Subsaximicrobium wynnwilliamsii]|uniref:Type II toxin-antitoxin system HipA family toxin n=1 Tax=Subsaximicrobium wynnwilliamsii TaxID=291179 RepID=A0A5C6ZHH0_9FLAO|nr:type II toxin-antitoxin system HipA family toxin [Subsaximicrobium wynnwilliamsii]TXD83871.1 type II toxin-antitoxin system HipA family toxin [Subsaximicrobium wynnwilliamsii]TXD89612.1 type II toxin-antitoxin system HipA family toxin [Subsaximicrobium wynnwilliamsii]TXE02597.1 type II toxin-antitoxin system HipA family toxin [Subsaximicrobium wynnwilliamsii]
MARDNIIDIIAFGLEVGKLGYDLDQRKSYFQYHPEFLETGKYSKLFPFIFKRTKEAQVFTEYQQDTFQGLPPMIADSLPDTFGTIIFQEWLTARGIQKITPLEQLAYVADRGMGALEYRPIKEIPNTTHVNIDEVITILEKLLKLKEDTTGKDLNELSLLHVFKIGTSAGGARPKILISEHKETGAVIAGDRAISEDYNHYLVKLHIDDSDGYNREKVEYAYYLLAQETGIHMMPSKLIENKHFATLRFDRQHGKKQHMLTVTGLTGWDFKSQPDNSSYENVFKVALGLEVPHKDLQQLFKRMVFNLVFRNVDDHLKNHSFIYNKESNSWNLGPAYDLTYALDPLFTFKTTSRALSINGKRTAILIKDVLAIAEEFSIKNPKGITEDVQALIPRWAEIASELEINETIINAIQSDLKILE